MSNKDIKQDTSSNDNKKISDKPMKGMDKFPDNFNRVTLNARAQQKQNILINLVREELFNTVVNSIEECENKVEFEFPAKLWQQYRKTLTIELLEKFGELKIYTKQGSVTTAFLTSDKNNIPSNIKQIEIEFFAQ